LPHNTGSDEGEHRRAMLTLGQRGALPYRTTAAGQLVLVLDQPHNDNTVNGLHDWAEAVSVPAVSGSGNLTAK
jgi:hypothetical protein